MTDYDPTLFEWALRFTMGGNRPVFAVKDDEADAREQYAHRLTTLTPEEVTLVRRTPAGPWLEADQGHTGLPEFMSVTVEVLHEIARSIQLHGYHPEQPLGGGAHSDVEAAERAKDVTALNTKLGIVTWQDILREEYLEAFAETDPKLVREEMVQVAAVAFKIIDAIDWQARQAGY